MLDLYTVTYDATLDASGALVAITAPKVVKQAPERQFPPRIVRRYTSVPEDVQEAVSEHATANQRRITLNWLDTVLRKFNGVIDTHEQIRVELPSGGRGYLNIMPTSGYSRRLAVLTIGSGRVWFDLPPDCARNWPDAEKVSNNGEPVAVKIYLTEDTKNQATDMLRTVLARRQD
jgi:hypothetical protein